MKVTVTCVSATLQHVYEDKIDEDTGTIVLNPTTMTPVQRRLPDRQVVELSGPGVFVRLDGSFETVYEVGKTYALEVQ